MHNIAIQQAIEEQNRLLHTAKVSFDRLQNELFSHLTAVALGSSDNGRADELRSYLQTHKQTMEEVPQVLTRLFVQEAALQEQAASDLRQSDKEKNDQYFFELLERIIAEGKSTPADMAMLNQYAGFSTNPARRYDLDRLIEALEDHDRKLHVAKSWNRDLPVFTFKLEEEGGK